MKNSSLVQTQAITEMAALLYGYLPGSSPSPSSYTLASAASEAGVAEYWEGGSKRPALVQLLERTLTHKPGLFCKLVLAIIRHGIPYRTQKGNPISRDELVRLNGLISRVGFKIPELWDPSFLESLPDTIVSSPHQATVVPVPTPSAAARRSSQLAELRPKLDELNVETNRQAAGLKLEALLKSLFTIFDLEPGSGFRVKGEQIDGSFMLDRDVYLLEAKWEKEATDAKELYAFRAKIEGKSSFTRGLFLAMNGFSRESMAALAHGKQPTFILMYGVDLYDVVCDLIPLDTLLREKLRHLAETGEAFVSARDIHARISERS